MLAKKIHQFIPIYEMEWNSKRILISFYLRLYLLYSNKEEVKIIKKKRYA